MRMLDEIAEGMSRQRGGDKVTRVQAFRFAVRETYRRRVEH
jgi:hypothetical protein